MVIPENLSVDALASFAHQRNNRVKSIHQNAIDSSVQARRTHSAQDKQKEIFANELLASEALQKQAGGIAGKVGADAALADAVKQKRKAYADAVDDATQLLKHFNPSGAERQKLAMGTEDVVIRDKDTNQIIKVFSKDSTYMREAAIEFQLAGGGNYNNIQQIIEQSGSSLSDYVTTISDAVVKNKLAEKAPFLGGKTIDAISQGKIGNLEQLSEHMARSIAGGKIKTEHLVSMDQDALKSLVDNIAGKSASELNLTNEEDIKNFNLYASKLGNHARVALTDPRMQLRVSSAAEKYLKTLSAKYPPTSDTSGSDS